MTIDGDDPQGPEDFETLENDFDTDLDDQNEDTDADEGQPQRGGHSK